MVSDDYCRDLADLRLLRRYRLMAQMYLPNALGKCIHSAVSLRNAARLITMACRELADAVAKPTSRLRPTTLQLLH
jgi:hypothetical protein